MKRPILFAGLVFVLTLSPFGCSNRRGPHLSVDKLEFVEGSADQKTVTVDGTAEKIEPASDAGFEAKLDGKTITIAPTKEVRAGKNATFTVSGKGKSVTLEVAVLPAPVAEIKPPTEVKPPTEIKPPTEAKGKTVVLESDRVYVAPGQSAWVKVTSGKVTSAEPREAHKAFVKTEIDENKRIKVSLMSTIDSSLFYEVIVKGDGGDDVLLKVEIPQPVTLVLSPHIVRFKEGMEETKTAIVEKGKAVSAAVKDAENKDADIKGLSAKVDGNKVLIMATKELKAGKYAIFVTGTGGTSYRVEVDVSAPTASDVSLLRIEESAALPPSNSVRAK